MIPFLKELNKEFKKVCPESYLETNTAYEITFPYLTYSFQGNGLEDQEEFYIDVDIFDQCGANTLNLEILTHKLKKHFRRLEILTEDILVQFSYQSSRNIPTLDLNIKRRWVQLYCKVDWRK